MTVSPKAYIDNTLVDAKRHAERARSLFASLSPYSDIAEFQRVQDAQRKYKEAQDKLSALPREQAKEAEKVQKKIEKMNDAIKQATEQKKFDEKVAKQNYKAQQEYEKAFRNLEKAEDNLEKARREMEKYN